MMHGKLTLDAGVVSVGLPEGGHMDAAVSDRHAGIELALDEPASIIVGAAPSFRSPLTLSIDCERPEMERLLTLLAEKLELPAFNEGEWRLVHEALTRFATSNAGHLAERIAKAYGWQS